MFYPDLNELIHYQNEKLIYRFAKDYPNATMIAEDALSELMKFIWLCLKHRSDKHNNPTNKQLNFLCIIHPEMGDIDNMWHTFLLFTKDYHEFCNKHLGGIFFHHEPIVTPKANLLDEHYEYELSLYLSYIYDNLGEDTLLRWFSE